MEPLKSCRDGKTKPSLKNGDLTYLLRVYSAGFDPYHHVGGNKSSFIFVGIAPGFKSNAGS